MVPLRSEQGFADSILGRVFPYPIATALSYGEPTHPGGQGGEYQCDNEGWAKQFAQPRLSAANLRA